MTSSSSVDINTKERVITWLISKTLQRALLCCCQPRLCRKLHSRETASSRQRSNARSSTVRNAVSFPAQFMAVSNRRPRSKRCAGRKFRCATCPNQSPTVCSATTACPTGTMTASTSVRQRDLSHQSIRLPQHHMRFPTRSSRLRLKIAGSTCRLPVTRVAFRSHLRNGAVSIAIAAHQSGR